MISENIYQIALVMDEFATCLELNTVFYTIDRQHES